MRYVSSFTKTWNLWAREPLDDPRFLRSWVGPCGGGGCGEWRDDREKSINYDVIPRAHS